MRRASQCGAADQVSMGRVSTGKAATLRAGAMACIALAMLAGTARGEEGETWSSKAKARVASLELSGPLQEKPDEMSWLFGGKQNTLREVVEAIDSVRTEGEVDGLLIRLKDAELGASQVEEIGAAIRRVRESGKQVRIFGEAFGLTELMLGSYADEVLAQDGGPVMAMGLYMEEMFLADTLGWAGIKADMVQVGDYKGASEAMARSAPSPQWDENINQLLDSMYANIRGPILRGRELTDEQLDKAMGELWLADATDAKGHKLLDSVIDLPGLTSDLAKDYARPIAWSELLPEEREEFSADANPFAMLAKLAGPPEHEPTGDTIAVVHINGPIVDGESEAGFSGQSSVGSRTIRNALEDILAEDLIKGVVVRVDSPGGSATASEIIWQGVKRVAEKKPVWVSVGSMAASGGYYIAVSGGKIYVNPSSIVGSIGVVGGKMSMEDLYKNLRVNVVGRGRGPMAEMFASHKVWSEDQRAIVRTKMTQTYDLFTSRVSAGRPGIDLSQTAEGRLFTGDKAIALKMADKLGGLQVAIEDLAGELGLDDYEVLDYPAPRAFGEVLEDAMGSFVTAPNLAGPVRGSSPSPATMVGGVVREVLGEKAWRQMAPSVEAFMQLRDQKVLLVSPRVMVFR